MPKYFITPNYYVALNPKVGSSTLARVIIRAFYPEKEFSISTGHYPKGKSVDTTKWHFYCPTTNDPSDKPVIVPIRHPVNRFISAISELKIDDIDSALYALENNTELLAYNSKNILLANDPHMLSQNRLLYPESHLFKFPEHLIELMTLLNINDNIPNINASNNSTHKLSTEQIKRIQIYYKKDIDLYNSISKPDTIYSHSTFN